MNFYAQYTTRTMGAVVVSTKAKFWYLNPEILIFLYIFHNFYIFYSGFLCFLCIEPLNLNHFSCFLIQIFIILVFYLLFSAVFCQFLVLNTAVFINKILNKNLNFTVFTDFKWLGPTKYSSFLIHTALCSTFP